MQLVIIICAFFLCCCAQGNREKDIPTDYEIYDLIDSLTTHTSHSNFYELLKVSPSASSAEISSAYRKISMDWHPDRNQDDPLAGDKFAMLSAAAAILKKKESRERYDWILNEAPAWHRSGYYVKKMMTAKLSVFQVLIITIVFISIVHTISLYAKYLADLYHYKQNEKVINEIGSKEMKRLKRKMENLSMISLMSSPELQAIARSEIKVTAPKFVDLFFCRLIFLLFSAIKSVFALFKAFLFRKKAEPMKPTDPIQDENEELITSSSNASPEKKVKVRRKKQWEIDQESRESQSSSPFLTPSKSGSSEEEQEELKTGPIIGQEETHLIQLLNSFPPGTIGRWVLIAKKLNRSVDDVIDKVQEMKSKLK